jgi:MoaA/NifB/PqqE/SkfB family radical SAM enzyme
MRNPTEFNEGKGPIYPEVPVMFKGGESGRKYPEGYRPWVQGWSVGLEDLQERLPDGTFTLTQLDIAINPDDYVAVVNQDLVPTQSLTKKEKQGIAKRAIENYQMTCGVGCTHCIGCRRKQSRNPLMTTEEVFALLKEAKKLGLKTVKFLGPGEMMHNPRMFEVLDFLRENDIKIGIFTKGVALGDDKKAQEVFKMTAKELAVKVASYDNVSILLSMTSTDEAVERKRVESSNFPNLFEIRNRAIANLAEVGLNKDPQNQRLAIICTPVLNDNIDEVLDIYRYGLERNIPVVVAPTMLSGKGMKMKEITDPEFKERKLVDLYIDIYSMLIKEQIFTLEQLEEEGISPYAGYVCNQFIGGIMVEEDGGIKACPGNDAKNFRIATNVRSAPLAEIWKNSRNYKIREQLVREGKLTLTQPCYAKTEGLQFTDGKVLVKKGCGSIPEGFYEKVMEGVRARALQQLVG